VYGADDRISAGTLPGAAAAISIAIAPPVWCPSTAARSRPSASSSAHAPSAMASTVCGAGSGALSPKPRMSIAITR
jgi:hypothetical protein